MTYFQYISDLLLCQCYFCMQLMNKIRFLEIEKKMNEEIVKSNNHFFFICIFSRNAWRRTSLRQCQTVSSHFETKASPCQIRGRRPNSQGTQKISPWISASACSQTCSRWRWKIQFPYRQSKFYYIEIQGLWILYSLNYILYLQSNVLTNIYLIFQEDKKFNPDEIDQKPNIVQFPSAGGSSELTHHLAL